MSALEDHLKIMDRWADSVELRNGKHGWTLTCLVHGKYQSVTHSDLDELVSYFIEHAVMDGNWPVGFYREIREWRSGG
jgi:hypothetical protein